MYIGFILSILTGDDSSLFKRNNLNIIILSGTLFFELNNLL